MTVLPMKTVTRDEYLAYIGQFPDRLSYRTGICEPPQEHCVIGHMPDRGGIDKGTLIGRITFNDLMRDLAGQYGLTEADFQRKYQIRDDQAPGV
jgi:hypothetical protein